MESCPIGVIQPVAGVKRQELHFGAFREICGFVNDEPSGFDRSLNGHEGSVPLDRPPNKARSTRRRPWRSRAAAGAGEPRDRGWCVCSRVSPTASSDVDAASCRAHVLVVRRPVGGIRVGSRDTRSWSSLRLRRHCRPRSESSPGVQYSFARECRAFCARSPNAGRSDLRLQPTAADAILS